MDNIRLVDRDYLILRELDRWYVCLGRHIKELAGFKGQRACDRRLRKLLDTEYITRKKLLYGVPSIYQVGKNAKYIENVGTPNKIRIERVKHDILVLDTAIKFHQLHDVPFSDMTTEKQMHMINGFGARKHYPDFMFAKNGKTTCVEVEMTLKAKQRLEKNTKSNFLAYDKQIWVVPNLECNIAKTLMLLSKKYTTIELLELKEVLKND